MAETPAIPDTVPPKLPEDVLMEILCLLPAKSLLRFKSVSKHWRSLIENPSFIANHHNRSKALNRNESLLVLRSLRSGDRQTQEGLWNIVDSGISISFVDTQTLSPFSHIGTDLWEPPSELVSVSHYGGLRVFGPCNGIICITDASDIILSNPATREFKTLPLPPFSYPKDMTAKCHSVGFGYDPVSDDYKVPRIVEVYEEDPYSNYPCGDYKTEIYSLKTDSWREIDAVVPVSVFYFPSFEMFFNGAFHWYGLDDSIGLECIVSFDMKDEVFRQIDFPKDCYYPDGKARSLSVWNDLLALILYSAGEPETMDVEIWVMKEYGVKESWTKEFSLELPKEINKSLGIWKDRELLMERNNGQLVSVDLQSQEIKEFDVYGVPTTLRALPYTESLVSLNRMI